MKLTVLTTDAAFRTAVASITGALGHEVVESGADVVVCDVGTVDFASLAPTLVPLATILMLPATAGRMPSPDVLAGFVHQYQRKRLLDDLPDALALLSAG